MAHNRTLEKADARRNMLFVLPMTLFAVVLVALPLIYVLGTSLVESGQDFSLGATFTLNNYKSLLRADFPSQSGQGSQCECRTDRET